MKRLLILLLLASALSGCESTIYKIKDAASGIGTAADQAAKATSLDAHAIRAIEINYNNETFSMNDLFQSILRDVQWKYENSDNLQQISIKGTWQDPLFSHYNFSNEQKANLKENGIVKIEFTVQDSQIIRESTKLKMELNEEEAVKMEGEDALTYLYDTYTSIKQEQLPLLIF
ncbi:hypothetical protein D1B33_06565 [Lysinibacillus yapensis]|uniref:23S rRNA methyltransferase n=1 Tax=Ureibacillus yapensis TaxID=2304605 RepID=A0A396SIJ0_9BACL|nr:hypothetical protein [Lysinibacillus yapensis]RHW38535.1 hypothetical protein D1B33_06565 [Lysinibacillus yapensis]